MMSMLGWVTCFVLVDGVIGFYAGRRAEICSVKTVYELSSSVHLTGLHYRLERNVLIARYVIA